MVRNQLQTEEKVHKWAYLNVARIWWPRHTPEKENCFNPTSKLNNYQTHRETVAKVRRENMG